LPARFISSQQPWKSFVEPRYFDRLMLKAWRNCEGIADGNV